ncbi:MULTISPECIES: GNAT family N-acetyltransferase [Spirulina sp. CCY15215]|uniref:GNAT family N-acetyltransferase n=1 Tax=Spirulina sp. CCY15215 TaxID=2767591 RepID=UPI00194F6D0B|nr:GNAT family N-acetyltransferase [Spirulina major]
MRQFYRDFLIRDWQVGDRTAASNLIRDVLLEYGLPWECGCSDRDVIEVEEYYLNQGGEFWVVEYLGKIVGTGAYYPIEKGYKAVELRKMYLLPEARGQGLGRFLLQQLEMAIAARGFQEIWLETATILKEAVKLYESYGYQISTGVETQRCDRLYIKKF